MFTLLLELIFSWLPGPLWLCVWAVIAVAFFIIMLKVIGVVLDLIFRFIDLFI